MLRRHFLVTGIGVFSVSGDHSSAQENAEVGAARKDLIERHRVILLFRDFEALARHTYFLVANALLAVNGGWNERDQRKTQVTVLSEQISGTVQRDFAQIKARTGRTKSLTQEQGERMSDGFVVFDEAIASAERIVSHLRDGDLESANSEYVDHALPAIQATWNGNWTLILDAERAFPRR